MSPYHARMGQKGVGPTVTTEQTYVGIDVSKRRLDIAVRPSEEVWSVSNDQGGIDALADRLRSMEPTLVVMEATGGPGVPGGG